MYCLLFHFKLIFQAMVFLFWTVNIQLSLVFTIFCSFIPLVFSFLHLIHCSEVVFVAIVSRVACFIFCNAIYCIKFCCLLNCYDDQKIPFTFSSRF